MNEEYLYNLPAGSVVSVIGAGGKTSLIHRLVFHYRKKGFRVLATTTTHMMEEAGLLRTAGEVREALEREGYAFAGLPANDKPGKVSSLPHDELRLSVEASDIAFIEADGARHMSFKVPYSHEPVIPVFTTHIVLVAGMEAVGKTIRESCYNPLGTAAAIGCSADTVLTPELMASACRRTYLSSIAGSHPAARMIVCPEGPSREPFLSYGKRFLESFENKVCFHFLVLAAGYSKRFGENKLLYEIGGKPMYRHIVDKLSGLKAPDFKSDLTIVTQYPEIVEEMASSGIHTVINTDPSRGIASSLVTGIEEISRVYSWREGEYLVCFTADQPFLRVETILMFLKGFLASGRSYGCPSNGGRLGNPCIFPRNASCELLSLSGDKGGKSVIRKHTDNLYVFENVSHEELEDIDFK